MECIVGGVVYKSAPAPKVFEEKAELCTGCVGYKDIAMCNSLPSCTYPLTNWIIWIKKEPQ